jgi:hypothetical protein
MPLRRDGQFEFVVEQSRDSYLPSSSASTLVNTDGSSNQCDELGAIFALKTDFDEGATRESSGVLCADVLRRRWAKVGGPNWLVRVA